MIGIQSCSASPSTVACGQQVTVTTIVTWAGGGARSVRVCLNTPAPCTLNGNPCATRTGPSGVAVPVSARFTCPAGSHQVPLTVVATAQDNGDTRSTTCFVTVNCP